MNRAKMYCNGNPPRILKLVTPWWETSGQCSLFKCGCPIPDGATARDMNVYRANGYYIWLNDKNPKRPSIKQLTRKNKSHVQQYA